MVFPVGSSFSAFEPNNNDGPIPTQEKAVQTVFNNLDFSSISNPPSLQLKRIESFDLLDQFIESSDFDLGSPQNGEATRREIASSPELYGNLYPDFRPETDFCAILSTFRNDEREMAELDWIDHANSSSSAGKDQSFVAEELPGTEKDRRKRKFKDLDRSNGASTSSSSIEQGAESEKPSKQGGVPEKKRANRNKEILGFSIALNRGNPFNKEKLPCSTRLKEIDDIYQSYNRLADLFDLRDQKVPTPKHMYKTLHGSFRSEESNPEKFAGPNYQTDFSKLDEDLPWEDEELLEYNGELDGIDLLSGDGIQSKDPFALEEEFQTSTLSESKQKDLGGTSQVSLKNSGLGQASYAEERKLLIESMKKNGGNPFINCFSNEEKVKRIHKILDDYNASAKKKGYRKKAYIQVYKFLYDNKGKE